MDEAMRQRISAYIYSRCFEKGNFILTSGKKTNYYIDMKQAFLIPEGSYLISTALLELVAANTPEAEAVGGPALGAVPLVSSMSVLSYSNPSTGNLPSFIVRKEKKTHGTTAQVECPPLPRGTKVIIVDDVVTTGGSTFRAVDAAAEMGWETCGVFTVVDRMEGGKENMDARGLKFYPLLLVSDLDKLEAKMERRFPLSWAAANAPAGDGYLEGLQEAWPEAAGIYPTIGSAFMLMLHKILKNRDITADEARMKDFRRRAIRLLKHLVFDPFDAELDFYCRKIYKDFVI